MYFPQPACSGLNMLFMFMAWSLFTEILGRLLQVYLCVTVQALVVCNYAVIIGRSVPLEAVTKPNENIA